MKVIRGVLALLLVLLMFTSSGAVVPAVDLGMTNAAPGELDNPPVVGISQQHGAVFSDMVVIHGMVHDEVEPIDLQWELLSDGEVLVEDSMLDSLFEATSGQDGRSSWHWTATFNISSWNPCACQFLVRAIDASAQLAEDRLLLFGRSEGDELPPSLLLETPSMGSIWRGELVLTGVAFDDDGSAPEMEWAVLAFNQAQYACARGSLSQSLPIDDWNTAPEVVSPNGGFRIVTPTDDLEDGWLLLLVRAHDGLGNHSSVACTSLALQNNPPIAELVGPSQSNESERVTFDASASDDPSWGREGLQFTFLIHREGGIGAPEMEQGERQVTFTPVREGNYTVSVIVTDTSGLSAVNSTTLQVSNVAPRAVATVDGIPFDANSVIRLSDSKQWILDASGTEDTENDQGSLIYTWYIDGDPLFLGETRALMRAQITDDSKTHSLALTVEDDDGVRDSLSTRFGIVDTPSDPLYEEPLGWSGRIQSAVGGFLNMLLLFTLAMVVIAFVTARLTSGEREGDIPRWIPKRMREQRDDEDDDSGAEPESDEEEDTAFDD
ncbi:MAG: hypothetical protein CXX71_00600 [Methanobacteriota archaeon]|nr:MAG: hypothetical protein CXX71_00600 [Euryarchaeota archaeon]